MIRFRLYLALHFSYWVGSNAQFLLRDPPAAKARWSNLSFLEEYSKEVTKNSKFIDSCEGKNRGYCAIDSVEKCGPNMSYKEKLIVKNSENRSNPIITVCFDETKVQAIYTIHDYEPCYNDRVKTTNWKDDVAVLSNTEYKNAYKNTNQEISSSADILQIGHLSPNADLTMTFGQTGGRFTFFWINSSPQWKEINTGAWKRVEADVRIRYDNGSKVITGNLDILKETDIKPTSNTTEGLFLIRKESGNKIPIPRFLWKVVISTTTDRRPMNNTLYVVHNNPNIYKEGNMTNPCGCGDDCQRITKNSSSQNNPKWGVFCCEFSGNDIPCPVIANLTENINLTTKVPKLC